MDRISRSSQVGKARLCWSQDHLTIWLSWLRQVMPSTSHWGVVQHETEELSNVDATAKLLICLSVYIPTLCYGHKQWVVTETMRLHTSNANELPSKGVFEKKVKNSKQASPLKGSNNDNACEPCKMSKAVLFNISITPLSGNHLTAAQCI